MMADDGLSVFDSTDEGPVAIVFGTFNYRRIIWRWIEAARRASCAGWRIVSLDRELVRWLQEHGAGAQAVYYYDVLPDAPRHDFAALQRNALMRVLLQDPEARWEICTPVLRRRPPKPFWRRIRPLLRQLLAHSRWVDVQSFRDGIAEARKDGSLCVLTSESIIRGGFSGGLTVGVIPMHLVTRFV